MTVNFKGNDEKFDDISSSKWTRYSPKKTFFQEPEIQEFPGKVGNSKLSKNFFYYSWNIWRWFSPNFYQNLFNIFFQFQKHQEEKDFKSWFNFISPKRIQLASQELKKNLIINWTFEKIFRVTLSLVFLLVASLQVSYFRYSFLLKKNNINNLEISTYKLLSWKDFKQKDVFAKNTNKIFKIYDKFIIAETSNKNYRIDLPPITSNKEMIEIIRKINFSKTKEKLNYFRYIRESFKTTEISFYNDLGDYSPGIFSNLSILIRIYITFFPLYVIIKIWNQMNSLKDSFKGTKAGKISNVDNKKRFKNLAGIEQLLPDLNELIQSLKKTVHRSSSQVKINTYAPKGYILVGPPGTGKTLLAQAIAGESQGAFFFTAGSEFIEEEDGIGPARLRNLFQKAKKEAPAIIFIDEIDTIGKVREGSINSLNNSSLQRGNKIQILTEFLVQMDGFSPRNNLIIIGATNFLNLLDPAFIRPGRFDRIFELELPSRVVRIEILKLHANNSALTANKKVDPFIPWDFFGKSTIDFSGADLSAIVNESLLKMIREKKDCHNFETLQHGLDRISTYSKDQLSINSLFIETRKSYYQAGIAIISSLFFQIPNQLVLSLQQRPKNLRFKKIEKIEQRTISNIENFEIKLLGYLSGVAAEFYIFKQLSFCHNTKEKFWLSQQGVSDLEQATNLLNRMINKYQMYINYFCDKNQNYLNSSSLFKRFNSLENYSYNEVWDSLNMNFLRSLNGEKEQNTQLKMNWRYLGFWVWQITNQQVYEKNVSPWGKPSIDENSFLFDKYFHKNQRVKLTYQKNSCYFIQDILLFSFKKVIKILESKQELLDFMAYSLLLKERLIEKEILDIVEKFENKILSTDIK
jgi:cell division protease FtsH